jgi:hypothetical protein
MRPGTLNSHADQVPDVGVVGDHHDRSLVYSSHRLVVEDSSLDVRLGHWFRQRAAGGG